MLLQLLLIVAVACASDTEPLAQRLQESVKLPAEGSKDGFGVLFFVYAMQPVDVERFLYLALASARTYAASSPSLPLAIAISHPELMTHKTHPFAHVLTIPAVTVFAGRQWVTRVLSLALTPFKLTLAVDSDTLCCADLSVPMRTLYDEGPSFDFAANGASLSSVVFSVTL